MPVSEVFVLSWDTERGLPVDVEFVSVVDMLSGSVITEGAAMVTAMFAGINGISWVAF